MSKKKQEVPEPKSTPVLGWIALFAVIAAVAVFAFTRESEPPAAPQPASTVAQQPQPVPAQPEPQPAQPAPQTTTPAPAPAAVPTPEPTLPVQRTAPANPPHSETPGHTHSPTAPIVTPSPVSTEAQSDYRIPAHFKNPKDAQPLAATLPPETVQAHAKAAYEVAQKKPLLLAQMPCFCYCDRFGHKSLHDCYVGNHAEECDVCMKEAIEADQMDSEGMSPEEIRAVLIANHHPRS